MTSSPVWVATATVPHLASAACRAASERSSADNRRERATPPLLAPRRASSAAASAAVGPESILLSLRARVSTSVCSPEHARKVQARDKPPLACESPGERGELEPNADSCSICVRVHAVDKRWSVKHNGQYGEPVEHRAAGAGRRLPGGGHVDPCHRPHDRRRQEHDHVKLLVDLGQACADTRTASCGTSHAGGSSATRFGRSATPSRRTSPRTVRHVRLRRRVDVDRDRRRHEARPVVAGR